MTKKESKKILIISLTNLTHNGITSVIYNYCKHMDLENLELNFVAINELDSVIEQKFESLGKVHSISHRKKHFFKYLKDLNNVMKENYDVIHVHGNSATMTIELLLARIHGIKKRIAHCHTTICTYKKIHTLLSPVFRRCYTYALACSQSAGDWIYGIKEFTVLKNAIDLETYQFDENIRQKYRVSFQCNEDTLTIGHVGHFSDGKNHLFLLEIFKQINDKKKNSKLILIGDGLLRAAIEKKILELGLEESVVLLGKIDYVHEVMQAFDVFVFPSKWEGLGMVLIEAQASGLPCFASTKVPQEVDVTGLVSFISLEEPIDIWREKIMENQYSDISRNSALWSERIRERGYDIEKESATLRKLYVHTIPKIRQY